MEKARLRRWLINHIPTPLKIWRYTPEYLCWEFIKPRVQTGIVSGPFNGMKYSVRSYGSLLWPKILGTYEQEIADIFETVLHSDIKTFIDVGAAEGYYACGAAFLRKDINVVAFELDVNAQAEILKLATENGLNDRIQVLGECTVSTLERLIDQDCFVLMDVEGAEESLLDPAAILALKDVQILVECHDFIIPGITEELANRFSKTHSISKFTSEIRSIKDFPWALPWWFPTAYHSVLMTYLAEGRPSTMNWLYLKPIASP